MFPISSIASAGIPGLGLQPGLDGASGPAKMGEAGAFPMELGKMGGLDQLGGAGGSSGIGGITGTQPSENSFSSMLGHFVQDVSAKQGAAADAVTRLQSGGDVSLHQAVISMEEANVSFQLMVEVRNKLLESYQEIMRMQI